MTIENTNTYRLNAEFVVENSGHHMDVTYQSIAGPLAVRDALLFCADRMKMFDSFSDAERPTLFAYLQVDEIRHPVITAEGRLEGRECRPIFEWKEGHVRHATNVVERSIGTLFKISSIIPEDRMVPCPVLGGVSDG